MDLIARTNPPLPLRAWKALRSRGAGYAWHKFLRRSLERLAGRGNDESYTPTLTRIGRSAAAMIIFGNKKAKWPEVSADMARRTVGSLSTHVDPRSRLRLWKTARRT